MTCCSYFKLPTVLSADIIFEWIKAEDVGRLDSACCNKNDRPLLLALLKERKLNIYSVQHRKYRQDLDKRIRWIVSRGVRCSEFFVGSDAPGADAEECIKLSGDSLRTFEVYNPCGTSFSRFLQTVSIHCHGLETLKIWFWSENTDSINEAIAANPRLQILDIYSAINLFLDLSHVCLTHLSLTSCVLSHTSFLASGGGLIELDLSQCTFISSSQTAHTIGAYCTQLQSLYLSGTNVDDTDITHIVTHCRWLTALDLSKCSSVTDAAIVHIAQYSNNLQHLQIECNDQLTNYALEMIGKYAAVSTITTLCIDSCSGFTADGLTALLTVCAKITHLSTTINENAAYYLAQCVHLCKLDLLGVSMDLSVCETIAAHCANLQVLSLLYCDNVREENFVIIAKGCPKLRTIKSTNSYGESLISMSLLDVEPNEYRTHVEVVRSWSNNKNIRCRW